MNTWNLLGLGQSPWLDYIERQFTRSSDLRRMVGKEGLRGMTSNPTIFDKSIRTGKAYEADIIRMAAEGKTATETYESLSACDIREAALQLRLPYEYSKHYDGYVSLEPPSQYAYDLERTLAEVPRHFRMVGEPNVMIKVPGTAEGVVALRRLIASGININVTLIFSPHNYAVVAQAYIDGLLDLDRKGGDLGRVASVASVFVSRIDTAVDNKLQGLIAAEQNGARKRELEGLLGTAAIANSQVIYQLYRRRFSAPDFKALETKGARPQRLLWGSTSTKNPAYSDLKYIEGLIGPGTVNTMPLETWQAFNDHGKLRVTLSEDATEARKRLDRLEELGISMEEVHSTLQREGVDSFAKSLDSLLAHLEEKRKALLGAVP
ncbi:MAG: transaldolase [Chloroflexi bacterium]|nr:transaldolase [Chloroflexota bacterium]